MIRQIKIAKDTAVKARTQAIVTLKTLVVTAPPELREQLEGLAKMALIERCAGLRPGRSRPRSRRPSMPSVAWLAAGSSSRSETGSMSVTSRSSPSRSHPRWSRRLRSVPTRPPRCSSSRATTPTGSAPNRPGPEPVRRLSDPRQQRQDQSLPAQPWWPPPGQLGAVSNRHRPPALPPADHRLRRPEDGRGQDEGGDHPLSEALRRSRGLGLPPPRAPPGGGAGTGR